MTSAPGATTRDVGWNRNVRISTVVLLTPAGTGDEAGAVTVAVVAAGELPQARGRRATATATTIRMACVGIGWCSEPRPAVDELTSSARWVQVVPPAAA